MKMKPDTIHKRTSNLFSSVGIDWEKAYAISDGGSNIDYELEISPNDFLQFAEKDLDGSDIRALINGLSNAKRAIDAQTDIVLNSLGIRADRLSKPKTQLLNDLGIVAPRIIRKIRDTRNLLEHEYKPPSRSQVEDAIDVATLFIAACSRTIFIFPDVVKIFNEDVERDSIHLFKSYISIFANWRKKVLTVYGTVNLEPVSKKAIQIHSEHELHFLLVRLFAAVNTDKKVDEALKSLEKYVKSSQRG